MRRGLIAFVALAVLAACQASPTQVDAAATLRAAGTAMAKLKTVTATLAFKQGAITFQGFTLVSAKTSVRMPADSDTFYTVKRQDISISLEVLISGGHVYVHLPFSTFQEFTGSEAAAMPDLAKLFDPATGLPAVIPAGRNPKYIGAEKLNNVDTQKLSVTYSADQVKGMLAQLGSSGDVSAQIWVGTSDHLIRKAVLDGAFGDGGKPASVEVNISGFDAPVNITPPSP
ncbi:MAG TPA: LppX_LprAFG lipoprotein [Candidatus Nitrosotalea sp.]|nr:LppX_LprAFG lipoprotein [Candidatus Nitrosotalea sp.]